MTPRFVVQERGDQWAIVDTVSLQTYGELYSFIGLALHDCEVVNAEFEQMTKLFEPRCWCGAFLPCALGHHQNDLRMETR